MPKAFSRDQAKKRRQAEVHAHEDGVQKARALAQEVLGCLDGFSGDLPTGEAQTEGERLAAVLIFLRSLTIEYVNRVADHTQIAGYEKQRFRVAREALGLFNDIARKRRGPIHSFFAGCGQELTSRKPTSREISIDCQILACLKLIMEADKADGLTRERAIERMMERPGIAPHIRDPKRLDNVQYGSAKKDPTYPDLIADWTDIIKAGCGPDGPNAERALNFTEAWLTEEGLPLMFEDAGRTMRQGVSVQAPDGRMAMMRPRPHPMPLLVSRKALPRPASAAPIKSIKDGAHEEH